MLLNTEQFLTYSHPEMPIHKGFTYLTDIHKSDYARAYMMYFYGGGYSDVKPNEFDWNPYFDKLFGSEYDVIGYAEKSISHIAMVPKNFEERHYIEKNYFKFIGNGHYIFKPKTDIAYRWIMQIHLKMDLAYDSLIKNPGVTVHITDPNYKKITGNYPFEWNEICGRIFHRLQYEDKLENVLAEMPFTKNINYL